MEGSVTDRNDERERTEEAESRELEAAGWEAKARGPRPSGAAPATATGMPITRPW